MPTHSKTIHILSFTLKIKLKGKFCSGFSRSVALILFVWSKTFSALKYLPTLIGISQSWLVYGGDDSYQRSGYSVLSWREVANN
jgi:hypothetical protein